MHAHGNSTVANWSIYHHGRHSNDRPRSVCPDGNRYIRTIVHVHRQGCVPTIEIAAVIDSGLLA